MAQSEYSVKKITTLEANTEAVDNDLLVVGNNGTAIMKKLTFANLANSIRDKLKNLTFTGTGGLNTTNKTLPGAINELNTNFFFAGNFSGSSDEALMPDVLSAIRTHFSSVVSGVNNPTYTISFMRNGAWMLFGYITIRANIISMVVYRGATPEAGYHVLQTASDATPSIVRLPTRSEVDALNTNLGNIAFRKLGTGTAKTSFTLTVASGNERHIIWSLDSNAARTGMYAVYSTGAGAAGCMSLAPGSYTVTTSNNTVTFTSGSSGNPLFLDMIIQGNPLTIS